MVRSDGRRLDQLRTVTIEPNVMKFAEGSALIALGDTRVLCAASIEEKVPQWMKGRGTGWVTAEYSMLPRATSERTQREAAKGRLGGRTQEIQRIIGRALRAVADDHQAAQSVGIPLRFIWVIVWSVAGVVGLVAGIMWGSHLGVQFSISLVALKALPVLMLGGFTSIPGAIVGGLIVGVGEKVAEVFWGPAFGGAIEDWFAYVLALVFLLFRPQGLFGERIIERV